MAKLLVIATLTPMVGNPHELQFNNHGVREELIESVTHIEEGSQTDEQVPGEGMALLTLKDKTLVRLISYFWVEFPSSMEAKFTMQTDGVPLLTLLPK